MINHGLGFRLQQRILWLFHSLAICRYCNMQIVIAIVGLPTNSRSSNLLTLFVGYLPIVNLVPSPPRLATYEFLSIRLFFISFLELLAFAIRSMGA